PRHCHRLFRRSTASATAYPGHVGAGGQTPSERPTTDRRQGSARRLRDSDRRKPGRNRRTGGEDSAPRRNQALNVHPSGVLRWCDPFFNERIPIVAVGALPEELGASIAAAHEHMGIQIKKGGRGK